MTRHKWQELSGPVMADPRRRAEIEEMGRAMELVIALARLCKSQCEMPDDGAPPTAGTDRAPLQIGEDDSIFLATLREGIERLGGRLDVAAVFPNLTVQLIGNERGA